MHNRFNSYLAHVLSRRVSTFVILGALAVSLGMLSGCSKSESTLVIVDTDIIGRWRFEDAAKLVDLKISADHTYTIKFRKNETEGNDQIIHQNMMMVVLLHSEDGTWDINGSDIFSFTSKEQVKLHFIVDEISKDRLKCRLGKSHTLELIRRSD